MDFITLPKDTIVYRSYKDLTGRNGYWYSFKPNHTYGYGPITGEFQLKKDLKLIDITHEKFYDTLKESLKKITEKLPQLRNVHPYILFPLGFDDILFYRQLAVYCGADLSNINFDPLIHTDSILYFNNRSRLSINKCDIHLMKFLKNTLGSNFDGIISPKEFPDIIRNAPHFAELSVFDKESIEYIKDYNRSSSGGGSINNNSKFLPPIRYEDMSEWGKQQMDMADKIFDDWEKEKEKIKINEQNLLLPPVSVNNIKIKNGGGKNKINYKFKKTYKKKN